MICSVTQHADLLWWGLFGFGVAFSSEQADVFADTGAAVAKVSEECVDGLLGFFGFVVREVVFGVDEQDEDVAGDAFESFFVLREEVAFEGTDGVGKEAREVDFLAGVFEGRGSDLGDHGVAEVVVIFVFGHEDAFDFAHEFGVGVFGFLGEWVVDLFFAEIGFDVIDVAFELALELVGLDKSRGAAEFVVDDIEVDIAEDLDKGFGVVVSVFCFELEEFIHRAFLDQMFHFFEESERRDGWVRVILCGIEEEDADFTG